LDGVVLGRWKPEVGFQDTWLAKEPPSGNLRCSRLEPGQQQLALAAAAATGHGVARPRGQCGEAQVAAVGPPGVSCYP